MLAHRRKGHCDLPAEPRRRKAGYVQGKWWMEQGLVGDEEGGIRLLLSPLLVFLVACGVLECCAICSIYQLQW